MSRVLIFDTNFSVKPIHDSLKEENYEVFVINTLDAQDKNNPFERIDLTLKAHQIIKQQNNSKIPIIGLGHSLGCIDLLRSRPEELKACIFLRMRLRL